MRQKVAQRQTLVWEIEMSGRKKAVGPVESGETQEKVRKISSCRLCEGTGKVPLRCGGKSECACTSSTNKSKRAALNPRHLSLTTRGANFHALQRERSHPS